MKKFTNKITVITSLLWATAIIAAAIVKAPTYFRIMLLPLLAFTSLATIEVICRRINSGSGICA